MKKPRITSSVVLIVVAGILSLGIGSTGLSTPIAPDTAQPPAAQPVPTAPTSSDSIGDGLTVDDPVIVPAPSPEPSPPNPPVEPPPVPEPPAPSAVLREGVQDARVTELETKLKALHYDPGTIDSNFDHNTRLAVFAFQKAHGLTVDGLAGPEVLAALESPQVPTVLRPGGRPSRVEVDLAHQLVTVYRNGELALVAHVSTGSNETFCSGGRCREAVTPVGDFKFLRRISGWRTAQLGRLYNPVYFTEDGVAVHGSSSVPLHPASHGCVRISMHTANLFPKLVENGTDIHVAGR